MIVILATLAGAVLSSLGGVEASARDDLNAHELMELRRAIQQFTADTGHLPRTGPFALTTDTPAGSVDPTAGDPWPAEVSQGIARAWHHHPANLWQLYRRSLPGGHPLASWSPDTRRGWRGPYLSRACEGEVVVASDFATTDPVSVALPRMQAVADPHPALPLDGPFAQFVWFPWGSPTAYVRQGRPYLLILGATRNDARLVGLGPDGAYDGGADDDVTAYVFQ